MNERVINFCRAPSGLWVGWIVRDNAHYWGSGRTMDDLVRHVKFTLYTAKKCSTAGYVIATKPTPQDEVPLEIMDKKFQTRAWYGGKEKQAQQIMAKAEIEKAKKDAVIEAAPKKEYMYYETDQKDGTLIVYGIVREEVARFNLNPNAQKPTDDIPRVKLDINDMPRQPTIAYFADKKEDSSPVISNEAKVDKAAIGPAHWAPRQDFPTE